ncbi:alanine racemase [Ornithinibacillus gellani]|uniref:alanine racemase n=1 Tax=Ornithinibacillus gellani TaxID=2293253 RepID=UPI000F472321|nr:alanine racemase [Ornithinibacillus gellani]TQS76417.1 alanine racemase [Ornithinibacillus gellani]
MKDTLYRGTWVEINLQHIEYNIKQLQKKLPSETEVIAVVKANAYGHGSVPVAKRALRAGAKALAVALLEEAMELREAGITAPILVLGWVAPTFATVAAANQITLTYFQKEWLDELELPSGMELPVHMKWDTGMGRIGIRTTDELLTNLTALQQHPSVKLTGVFTHFATADEADLTYYHQQMNRFEALLTVFREQWRKPIAIHTGNSAASIRFPNDMQNYVRFGVSMYGMYPSQVVKKEREIDLKPAFSLHSTLIHVKQVPKGNGISYGKTYATEETEWVGTIPIGYGDGWNRKLQGFYVLVNGEKQSIIGRICMDMLMVRLDHPYAVGTKVTLIGIQEEAEIETDDIATYLDTINYEITCMINQRVPRKYMGE